MTFLFAGMAHVKVWKFVLLDVAAGTITASVPMLIGYCIGDLDKAWRIARQADLVIALCVAIGAFVIWWALRLRVERQSQA